jgi:phospholipid/cholesterol/gamma-HCH transport system substrate-binding protein
VVVLAMALITAASVAAINGLPFSNPYELKALVPADAPIVRDGDEVRVAGQRVGQVRGIDYTPEGRQIDMDIDDGSVSRDATVTVRLRGLAGAVYVDLTRGSGPDAPEGYTVPAAQTATGTQLTDVVAAFDRDTTAALSNDLNAYGGGLTGQGEGLNRALAELPQTLIQGRGLLGALRGTGPGNLSALTASADRTFRGLYGDQGGDVAGLITGGRQTLEASADSSDQLGAAIREAPGTLAEVRRTLPLADPLLDDLTRATTVLGPGVAALDRAMPSVNRLFSRRPELAQISVLARAATPVLELAGAVIPGLEPSARTLAPLADALRPLAAYVGRYPEDVFAGPNGFTTWGSFHYDEGQASGSRAVRFTPVLTCQPGRNPYPEPGKVGEDREPCAY